MKIFMFENDESSIGAFYLEKIKTIYEEGKNLINFLFNFIIIYVKCIVWQVFFY